MYKLGSSQLCITALFRRSGAAIQRNCQTRVQLNAMLPQAVYIPDQNWLIVANKPLSFTVMCLVGENEQLKTSPPISTLQLGPACEAYADGITLPRFYHAESPYAHTWQREALLTLQNTSSFSIWTPLDRALNDSRLATLSDLPELPEIEDVPLNTLVDKLSTLREPKQREPLGHWKGYVVYVLIAVLGLGLVLVVTWLKCPKGRSLINICLSTLVKRKITGTDTDQKSGQKGAESVGPSVENTEGQPREVDRRRVIETVSRKMSPVLLELASAP